MKIRRDTIIKCGLVLLLLLSISFITLLYFHFVNRKTADWRLKLSFPCGSPTIEVGENNMIYAAGACKFYTIDPSGAVIWSLDYPFGNIRQFAVYKGTVYINCDGIIYAWRSDGTLKWKSETYYYKNGPIIDSNGTLYFFVNADCWRDSIPIRGYLYALNPNGSLKWNFHAGWGITSPPVVGKNGIIYIKVASMEDDNPDEDDDKAIATIGKYIYALKRNGNLKWKLKISELKTGTLDDEDYDPVRVGKDGTIYAVYDSDSLYAITPECGLFKWEFKVDPTNDSATIIALPPVIGSDGTIYVLTGDVFFYRVYAIAPDGKVKWRSRKLYFDSDNDKHYCIAVAPSGTIYVVGKKFIYAINSNGKIKWKKSFGLSTPPLLFAIDKDNTVFVCTHDYLYDINPDGTIKWKFKIDTDYYDASLAVGNSRIYLLVRSATYSYILYAISKT